MPDDDQFSTSDVSDEQEWLNEDEDDDDDEGEVESLSVISLMDDSVFTEVMPMILHCKEKHNLDFLGIRDRLNLDFYGTIKLINFSQFEHDYY